MNEKEKQEIIERYNTRYRKYGYSPNTLGWNKGRNNLRFHILLNHWNLQGQRILDFGCGFGDMYGWLKRNGRKVDYEGVDINETLINEGKNRYPEAKLIATDLLSQPLDKKYDYIFASGVHNVKLKDNDSFTENCFELFDKLSVKGFAVNFLSDKVDEYSGSHHSNPGKILELAFSYSNRVVLRNDYMPFEFTVFVDKNSGYDNKLAVYPEYVDYL